MSTAVITGASSGIGRALAVELARRGYDLGLVARHPETLEPVKAEIVAQHPDRVIEVRRLDVTNFNAIPAVIEDLAAALGGLDLVVANAGVGGGGPVGMGTVKADRIVIETNVLGTIATADAAVTIFRRQNRGQIVFISSVAGLRGLPGSAAYSASKAAVGVYAEALRADVYGTPITVTTIYPGFIDTPLNQHLASRPFLVSVERATPQLANLIERRVASSTLPVYPWRLIAWLLHVIPGRLLTRITSRA